MPVMSSSKTLLVWPPTIMHGNIRIKFHNKQSLEKGNWVVISSQASSLEIDVNLDKLVWEGNAENFQR